jgi:hypothetical protein
VLLKRPDVQAAERNLQAMNANIGAARAALFPSITLTGSVGTGSNELDRLFGNNNSTWSFIPLVKLPIFDGGRNRANVQVAESNQRIALSQYEKSVQTAFKEVADVLADRAQWDERLAAQTSMVANTQKAFDLSNARFKAGVDNYLTVLDAQRSLYTAQQTLIGLRLSEQLNRVTCGRHWVGKRPHSRVDGRTRSMNKAAVRKTAALFLIATSALPVSDWPDFIEILARQHSRHLEQQSHLEPEQGSGIHGHFGMNDGVVHHGQPQRCEQQFRVLHQLGRLEFATFGGQLREPGEMLEQGIVHVAAIHLRQQRKLQAFGDDQPGRGRAAAAVYDLRRSAHGAQQILAHRFMLVHGAGLQGHGGRGDMCLDDGFEQGFLAVEIAKQRDL